MSESENLECTQYEIELVIKYMLITFSPHIFVGSSVTCSKIRRYFIIRPQGSNIFLNFYAPVTRLGLRLSCQFGHRRLTPNLRRDQRAIPFFLISFIRQCLHYFIYVLLRCELLHTYKISYTKPNTIITQNRGIEKTQFQNNKKILNGSYNIIIIVHSPTSLTAG